MMHVILIVVGLAAGLLSGSVGCRRWSDSALLSVCGIGCAMIIGNFIAMRFIRNVNKKLYQKVVAGIKIAVSLWLIVSQII